MDTGASCHVCSTKDLFLIYEPSFEKVTKANKTQAEVMNVGTILLKLTSGKSLTLQNVKHMPVVKKNMIYGSLLSKAGLIMDISASQMVMSYKGNYFGKVFCIKGMFKLQLYVLFEGINEITHSAYSLESWRNRLGHMHYKRLNQMSCLSLISKCGGKIADKCEVCS